MLADGTGPVRALRQKGAWDEGEMEPGPCGCHVLNKAREPEVRG